MIDIYKHQGNHQEINTFVKWSELMHMECEPEPVVNMRFLDLLSYEMRDPLTVISTSRFLLTRYADQLPYEIVEKHINIITNQILRIEELLNDSSKRFHSEVAKPEPRRDPMNLHDFCREQIKQVKSADAIGHSLNIDFDRRLEYVDLDGHLLGHILTNILANAVAYSATGTEVRLAVALSESDLVFLISDHGIGILPEDIPHIFEPFYRGSNVSDLQGTGLGLTVAKCCIDAYKGRIEIESKVEKGTTVRVYLPLEATK